MTITTVDSTIDAVTVYPDRARVTRVGACEVAAGVQQLVLNELPLTMDNESVRVTGRGTTSVRILSVDVGQQFYEETPAAEVQALQQEIETVLDEMKRLAQREALVGRQMAHIQGLWEATDAYAFGLSRGRSSVERQGELIAFLREQDEALQAEQQELEQAKRPLGNQLTKLKNQLKQLQSSRPKQRRRVTVEVEAAEAGSFEPEVSYVVRNASWKPLYDFRLQEDGAETALALSYIAEINQRTGEDWQGVALTVSTARPALNQRLPELHPWYVDVFRPRPPAVPQPKMVRKARAMSADVDDEAVMLGAAAPAPEMAMMADVSVAEVESSGTAVTFKVGGSTNIPSDGSPHKTTVAQYHFKPEIDYVSVPKHTDAVYRRVKVTNESQSPLLDGPVNLFVNDEYIGKNRLAYTATGGELELMLGVEERITIGRELVKRDVDKRFFGDKRRLRYGYEITIENLLSNKVQVTLQDHIPVARHEDIKVTLQETSVKPSEQSELNLLKWELTLAGKAKQVVRYEYMVEHPRSLQVTGLID